MVRLNIGILTGIGIGDGRLNQLLAIVSTDSSGIHQQVAVLDGRDDDAENTNTDTYAFRMDVVDDVGRLEEGMGVDVDLVQFLIGSQLFLVGLGRIGMGEQTSDIADIVVDGIAGNAVAGLKTLMDVIFRLPQHHTVGWPRKEGDKEQDEADDRKEDDSA